MKLKYYGIGIGLITVISCITLTFINLNNRIENKSKLAVTLDEEIYTPNENIESDEEIYTQNIDNENVEPSTKNDDSTSLQPSDFESLPGTRY